MKITKSQLKQIIKEELENVLSEKVDLDNLAGMIVSKNEGANPPWLMRGEWPSNDDIYEDPAGAFGAMMSAAYSHWISPKLFNNLKDNNKLAVKAAKKEIAALKTAGESGVVPVDAGTMISEMPAGRSANQAIFSGFGRSIGLKKQDVDPARVAPAKPGDYAPTPDEDPEDAL
jgi:hypothetical protein